MNNTYVLENKVKAVANFQMDNTAVKKFWNSFLLDQGELEITPCEEFSFCIGSTAVPVLEEGKSYAFRVDEKGIALVGKDYPNLMRGFMSLLMKIDVQNTPYSVPYMEEQSNYLAKDRMIHICVFPENDYNYIMRLLRLCALCQYTHVVIEFWGMLKFDCMKELAWPHAFTKEQAKAFVAECKQLGMEPIPMFNSLGHAPASRSAYGKHVMLDQNPLHQRFFTPDGWDWNIASDEVKDLHRAVRKELYEIFDGCEYIHIGCDEAMFIPKDKTLSALLPSYLKDLTHEVEAEGKRPMLWMDMLLEKDAFEGCYTVGDKDVVPGIRASLAKSSVFVDWQYNCTEVPIPSLASLKDCGHDVLGAPWNKPDVITATIETAEQCGLSGIMLTTWHTLATHMRYILDCAKKCGVSTFYWSECSTLNHEIAAMMRRVTLEEKNFEECGWKKRQIDI